jgi:hypothetical protein
MDITPKYIGGRGYEVEDNFIAALDEMDEEIAWKISLYIEKNLYLQPCYMLSTIGGVIHHFNKPITFAVKVAQTDITFFILTDLLLINMDEYLDLVNADSYFKPQKTSAYNVL